MVEPGRQASSGAPQIEPKAVRLLNTFLAIGMVLILVVLGIAREVVGEDILPRDMRWLLRLVAFAVLVGDLVVIGILWQRVRPDDLEARLRTYLLASFLAEGAAIVGAVFWFMTGDALILVGVTGPALLMLLVSRPKDEVVR